MSREVLLRCHSEGEENFLNDHTGSSLRKRGQPVRADSRRVARLDLLLGLAVLSVLRGRLSLLLGNAALGSPRMRSNNRGNPEKVWKRYSDEKTCPLN